MLQQDTPAEVVAYSQWAVLLGQQVNIYPDGELQAVC